MPNLVLLLNEGGAISDRCLCGAAKAASRWFPAVLLLALLSLPAQADANGLPLAARPAVAGGTLRPAASTTVGVVKEHLLLDLREWKARIRATYQLRNLAPEGVSLTVAFPVPRYDGVDPQGADAPAVRLDGEPLSFQPALAPVALADGETDLSAEWLDPFTGQAYRPPTMPHWSPESPAFLTFSVSFAGGQERRLEVWYRQDPGQDFARFIERSLRYDYLLLPARHWASFGPLEIEVLAPPDRVIGGLPPVSPLGDGHYGATFSGLPAQNLALFVAPGSGAGWISSWWWQRSGRAWILVAISVMCGLAAGPLRLLKPGFPHFIGTVMGVLVSTLIYALTPLNLFQPNPIGMMQTWFLFVPFLGLLYLVAITVPGRLVRGWPPPNRREK